MALDLVKPQTLKIKKIKKDRNWNKKNVINLNELDGYF